MDRQRFWYVVRGLLLCGLFLQTACNSRQRECGGADVSVAGETPGFRFPEIPLVLERSEDRLSYLVLHYWDHYPFGDSGYVAGDRTEQLFVDFTDLLQRSGREDAAGALRNLFVGVASEPVAFDRFRKLCEKYYDDPNSPMRNEAFYEIVLETVLAKENLSEAGRIRAENRLERIRKNRPGSEAPDFEYLTSEGERGRLSRLQVPCTVLFFYDPECSNCREVERRLSSSPLLAGLERKGQVKVLAVYPDEAVDEWKRHLSEMPAGWIVARNSDGRIREQELYELNAFPTIYLLDRDKRILLKDAVWETVFDRLGEIDSPDSL